MTKEELEKIKRNLPKGYGAIIGKRVGMPEDSVHKILNGYWRNDKVFDAALKLAEKEAKKNADRKKRAEQIATA